MFLTFIEGFIEVELMVTKRDDDDDRRQGEYRAICLWKMEWQSFAIMMREVDIRLLSLVLNDADDNIHLSKGMIPQ